MKKSDIEKMTFEDALKRLEETVRILESGNAGLDESLSIFEEGVSLVKLCTEILDKAEQKVIKLKLNGDDNNSEDKINEV